MIRSVLGSRASIGGVLGSGRGGAAATLPVAGATLWLDASQITGLSDGAAISTWTDATGNGRNATQETASARPTYKTNIVNGKPVARFDGGDVLVIANTTLGFTRAATFFLVITKTGTFGADEPIAGFVQSLPTRIGYFVTGGGNLRYNSFGASFEHAASNYNNTTSIISHTIANGAAAGWRNGASAGTAAPSIGSDWPANNYEIGHMLTLTPYFTGDIAEIIVYPSALSTANRQAVEAYLAAKYAIT